MSSMLEQAIVDAAALREAALKSAEQSIIDKYAPQVKEAVDSLLNKGLLEEQSIAASKPEPSGVEAPFKASPAAHQDQQIEFTMSVEEEPVYKIDLNYIQSLEAKETGDAQQEAEQETTPQLMDDLGLGSTEGKSNEDVALSGLEPLAESKGDEVLDEIVNILSEMAQSNVEEDRESIDEDEQEEVIEEKLVVDMAGEYKNGTFESNEATLQYQKEMQMALEEADELEEENTELKKENKKLSEHIKSTIAKNKKLLQIVKKLDNSLNETLLSNAKLLYSNRTLSDASLNERQKTKIVEAIAKAKSPEEAKNLQEALKTTVGTTKKDGPKSLRESVSRKSNLSGIMPRKQKPEQEFSFAEHMKKLAGIK